MAKKNIIITGGVGFIGSTLVKYLQKKYSVYVIDKQFPDKPINYVVYFQQDINEPLPEVNNVYAVIHLAAKAGVRESQEKFDEYVKDNILGTKSILDMCAKSWKPKQILIASSSSIYGERHNDEYHPKSLYAMSKVATETIAESYRNSKLLPETNICCMRIFTVYGPGQRKGLAIGNFIDNMLQDKPIVVYGDGTQRRSFTYIDDLCRGIEELLLEGRWLPHTIDIGYSNTTSINDIIYNLSKLLNKKVTIQYEDWDRHDVYKTKSNPCGMLPTIQTPLVKGLKRQIDERQRR